MNFCVVVLKLVIASFVVQNQELFFVRFLTRVGQIPI